MGKFPRFHPWLLEEGECFLLRCGPCEGACAPGDSPTSAHKRVVLNGPRGSENKVYVKLQRKSGSGGWREIRE